MLEVTSDEPQLWRMPVLEDWDRRGWDVEEDQVQLPEPAAEQVTTKVTVVGLRNRTIAAPGRILEVEQRPRQRGRPRRGPAPHRAAGDRRHLHRHEPGREAPPPRSWRTVKVPARGTYDHVTRLWPRRFYRGGDRLPEWIDHSPWGDALRLSQQLAAGTDSQLEVVRRVEDYLTSGRYRYTTDVDEPGEDPLLDFLFATHAGYCQHFAGAAALLLRLAGVPTRVVSGFATGKRTGATPTPSATRTPTRGSRSTSPATGGCRSTRRRPRRTPRSPSELDVFAPPDTGERWRRAHAGRAGGRARRAGRRGRAVHPPAAPPRGRARRGARPAGRAGRAVRRRCTRLRPRLAAIGPSVAALADEAERARFAADGSGEPPHPRLRVWRALARDVGRAGARGCCYVSGSSTVRRMCS